MGGAEQAGAGGGAAKDTGPRTGATERDDTAAMTAVVGRSDQLASAVDRFTECLHACVRKGSGDWRLGHSASPPRPGPRGRGKRTGTETNASSGAEDRSRFPSTNPATI